MRILVVVAVVVMGTGSHNPAPLVVMSGHGIYS